MLGKVSGCFSWPSLVVLCVGMLCAFMFLTVCKAYYGLERILTVLRCPQTRAELDFITKLMSKLEICTTVATTGKDKKRIEDGSLHAIASGEHHQQQQQQPAGSPQAQSPTRNSALGSAANLAYVK